jgi:hypothetical protein
MFVKQVIVFFLGGVEKQHHKGGEPERKTEKVDEKKELSTVKKTEGKLEEIADHS